MDNEVNIGARHRVNGLTVLLLVLAAAASGRGADTYDLLGPEGDRIDEVRVDVDPIDLFDA